ncbi:hypothetical protein, partial [Aerosakkonema funiforme]|uniref:hypothetical protein n=1 Tax=Aerosakkonema funiforme TaxID=1246630 RepID=UPI0035B8A6C3
MVGWVEERNPTLTLYGWLLGFAKTQPNLQIYKSCSLVGWVEERNPTLTLYGWLLGFAKAQPNLQ